MGVYLNSKKPYAIYKKTAQSIYFVDKTAMLKELFPAVERRDDPASSQTRGRDQRYICVTRPRRFGKTVMADMIASFFGKGQDSRSMFEKLAIGSDDKFEDHLNRHDVIYISFNEIPKNCDSYERYIGRIESRLIHDLKCRFPNIPIDQGEAVWDVLNDIYEWEDSVEFIFVFDEWDFIYHQDFAKDKDKKAFTQFLSVLLKDQPYVELAYMTGILPIAKHSSGSELNMFLEYSIGENEKYSQYFGFSDEEVDDLFQRYLKEEPEPKITRKGLEYWYDGYQTMSGNRLYNPRSVVSALTNNQLGSYWTSSGPYDTCHQAELDDLRTHQRASADEIFTYIKNDIANVREDIALMMAGIPVPAEVREYASTSMELSTKDEIYSAMVVYGFLTFADGYVSIPNKELMD